VECRHHGSTIWCWSGRMLCHLPMDLLGCCACAYDLVDSLHVYIVLVLWVYAMYAENIFFQLKMFIFMYSFHMLLCILVHTIFISILLHTYVHMFRGMQFLETDSWKDNVYNGASATGYFSLCLKYSFNIRWATNILKKQKRKKEKEKKGNCYLVFYMFTPTLIFTGLAKTVTFHSIIS